jgi:hypothetical protein
MSREMSTPDGGCGDLQCEECYPTRSDEDRLLELERFRARIERSWPADAELQLERDLRIVAEARVAEVEKELETAKANAMRFARELMETKSRLGAIRQVLDMQITHSPEQSNEPDKTVRELQQADPLQE